MLRKLIIAFGATAALGAAALAPTAASAGGFHGHHGHHGWHGGHWGHGYGVGFYGPTFVSGPDCYVVKRVIATPLRPARPPRGGLRLIRQTMDHQLALASRRDARAFLSRGAPAPFPRENFCYAP
jgi:hypothetical protein